MTGVARTKWLDTALRNLPIRQKLMVIILLTTAVALLLAGVGFVFADSFLFYRHLQRDLSAFAQIVADNTSAALAFDDPKAAQETLAALRARTHLVAACIYRKDGTVFASYLRSASAAACPAAPSQKQSNLAVREIAISRAVLLEDRPIGTLLLLYDLDEIFSRMQLYGTTVVIVLLVSILIAFLLSSSLRSIVATPISRLAGVAKSISETKDYTIRARKYSADELGILVDAFNEMLAGIQARDNELRKALSEVQQSNESLARSNEDLERFAFIASHDLQEPLRMITLYSQLLVRQYPSVLDGQGSAFVNNIVSSTTRMRELLADLLAYTEIGARVEQPENDVDLNSVVEKVLDNLKVSISDCGAIITADQLPVVRADEALLIPLFQNIIGNALKYRSDQPPRIRISVTELEDCFQFSIQDNGIGIDPEYHSKIFQAFKRLHGKQIPGTGIGLAICQRVVEKYEGRIWVESSFGNGSTFSFILPRHGAGRGEQNAGRSRKQQTSHSGD
jgi:signal transduction histidine kinase